MRETVPFSACPFYRFARRADGGATDSWGDAMTQGAQVEQEAWHVIYESGFQARKRKAGISEPEAENAGVKPLRAAVADAPPRIDPNGAWQVHTRLENHSRFDGLPDARKRGWRLGRRNIRLSGAGLHVESASRRPPPQHFVAGPAAGWRNPIRSISRLPAVLREENAQHAMDRRCV